MMNILALLWKRKVCIHKKTIGILLKEKGRLFVGVMPHFNSMGLVIPSYAVDTVYRYELGTTSNRQRRNSTWGKQISYSTHGRDPYVNRQSKASF
jgi:hypothetical protein